MTSPVRRLTVQTVLGALLAGAAAVTPGGAGAQPIVDAREATEIAAQAYVYFYPLVIMDVTRRQPGPVNAFIHLRAFPTADFKLVVRPNFDTLYSSAWLDLTKEPMIISTPDTGGRYYLMPMLDMWTDVFAAPGKRTSGTTAAHFAVVRAGWTGKLPAGVVRIEASTPHVWVIGRTQTDGPADYAAVHKIQDGYTITPLSQWGHAAALFRLASNPTDVKTSPLSTVNAMPPLDYFKYAVELMKSNPPHLTDWSMISRLKRIGIEVGKSYEPERLGPALQEALKRGAAEGRATMDEKLPTLARLVNGWQMNIDTMGVYGNSYLKRAVVARVLLGANQPEDAVYPLIVNDADGNTPTGDHDYALHFAADALPPVEAFWSLTMYDGAGFPVANPLRRFAVGNRDPLHYNADGSLDLYIQHDDPGGGKSANWLPGPSAGRLGLTLRLYAPRPAVLNGDWAPPPLRRVP
jgi:hypothetical protein